MVVASAHSRASQKVHVERRVLLQKQVLVRLDLAQHVLQAEVAVGS